MYTIGLRREDLYMEEDPVVSEAIRRLPQDEQDLRLFRLKRALDLSLKKALLPKDQWTSDEEVDNMYIYCILLGASKAPPVLYSSYSTKDQRPLLYSYQIGAVMLHNFISQ